MVRLSSVNPAKLKDVINTLIKWPELKVRQAMLLTHFSDEEVANLSLHCFIQQFLPSKMLKGLKAHVAEPLPPLPTQPDCTKRLQKCIIDTKGIRVKEGPSAAGVGACERVMALTPFPFLPWPPPAASSQGLPSSGAASTATNKWKTPPLLPPPPPTPPLPTPPPSPTDSPFLPALPQQLIHGGSMPMTLCACQLC